jgi:HPt (histidine-containing phosphotransfer) domain-containing protein
MDDFLAKPLWPGALRTVLAKWLAQASSAPPVEKCGYEDELEQVRDMFGAGFAELASLYQTDNSARIVKLREAGNARDCATVARIAHAFSGSSASIGAIGLSALCKELERHAKTNALEDIEQRLAAIETEYGRICSRVQSLAKQS